MGPTLEDAIMVPDMLITPDILRKAIRCRIDKAGMEDEAALEMARHVLSFFGHATHIIDNTLDLEDRDQFYMLEDAGVLYTEREETNLYDGSAWRIHYWVLRESRIFELAAGYDRANEAKPLDEYSRVYSELPDEVFLLPKRKANA